MKEQIKANELRIGNYVSDNIFIYSTIAIEEEVLRAKIDHNYNIKKSEVEDFYKEGEYSLNYFNLEPIPLTEEWLIKFGFERKDYTIAASFHIGYNPVIKDWLFELTWIKDSNDYSLGGFPFYRNGFFELKHVHQLQNLYFALTFNELTIQ